MRDAENSDLSAGRGAGVAAAAHRRDKIDRLCRYMARPAVATGRLELTAQGLARYTLKTPYRDGTTHVILRAACSVHSRRAGQEDRRHRAQPGRAAPGGVQARLRRFSVPGSCTYCGRLCPRPPAPRASHPDARISRSSNRLPDPSVAVAAGAGSPANGHTARISGFERPIRSPRDCSARKLATSGAGPVVPAP